MAIYTKKGDSGSTGLFGEEKRRSKDDLRISTIGSIDELNSSLGLAISLLTSKSSSVKDQLIYLQQDLFELAAEIASPKNPTFNMGLDKTKHLEKEIDSLEGTLPVLGNFIFPGGAPSGAAIHLSRSVARRTERMLVKLAKKEKVNPNILAYINRLSDLLFMYARFANKLEAAPENIWKK